MTLRLNGSTSGYTEIDAPAAAGNNTLLLPTGNGSNGNILGTDGAGNLSWVNGRMVLETAKASTSGTSVEFTGIPSWAKRVTLMLSDVSTNGASNLQIQIGSGSYQTSGYLAAGTNSSIGAANFTTGFGTNLSNIAAGVLHGAVTISLITGNTWVASGALARTDSATGGTVAGRVSLAGTLDRIRLTTINGTDAFDAGTVNIMYEG
jgi:hypothetical protein